MDQQPSIGRIVHYVLTTYDVATIRGIVDEQVTPTRMNEPAAGQTYPALVVRTFGGTVVNLRVFLDGDVTFWATSRDLGPDAERGRWHWPPRV